MAERKAYSYAHAQVAILAFAEPLDVIKAAPGDLLVPLITKIAFRTTDEPHYKLPGGMVEPNPVTGLLETPAEAASFELWEETGIQCPPENFVEIAQRTKERFEPHSGEFPIWLMVGWGADFKEQFNPKHGRRGDEGEILITTTFRNLLVEGFGWPAPSGQPGLHGGPVIFQRDVFWEFSTEHRTWLTKTELGQTALRQMAS